MPPEGPPALAPLAQGAPPRGNRSDPRRPLGHRHSVSELMGFLPKQWEATHLAERYPFFLFGGARGPGKSYWLRWSLLRFLLGCGRPVAQGGLGLNGVRVMLGCDTYPHLRDRQIVWAEQEFPDWLGYYWRGDKEFRLRREWGSGVLCFRHLNDVDSGLMPQYARIGVDELSEISSRVFNSLRGGLRWPGLPRAHFCAASNPTGRYVQWVRQLWIERSFTDDFAELADIQEQFHFLPGRPVDNPFLPAAYWEQLRALPPHLRKAWVEGDWYAGVEGLVYPNFGPENIGQQWDYRPGVPVMWACDDGWAPDPRVILFVQEIADNEYVVFDEYYATHELSEECIAKALEVYPYPKPEVAYLDPSMVEFSSRLWSRDIDTVRPRFLVEEGIKFVAWVVCDGEGRRRLHIHPRCRRLIEELQTYVRDAAGHPIKANDHGPDAGRYMIWARKVLD